MGGICVPTQQKIQNNQRKQQALQAQKRNKQALKNGVYAQKVRKYKQILANKSIMKLNSLSKITITAVIALRLEAKDIHKLEDEVLGHFEGAHKNGFRTLSMVFTLLNQEKRTIQYRWVIYSAGKKIQYDVRAVFDSQDKFYKIYYNMKGKSYDHAKYCQENGIKFAQPEIMTRFRQQQVSGKRSGDSSNHDGPSTDWNAQSAKSNLQFRQNMSRQAQQWTSYNQGKGWS